MSECEHVWETYWEGGLGYTPTDSCRLCHAFRPACRCFWTDPSTWLSAASCGYGSGYEPGSQMEWNPECPVHGSAQACDYCDGRRWVTVSHRTPTGGIGPTVRDCPKCVSRGGGS
jgi:hypothetical protein